MNRFDNDFEFKNTKKNQTFVFLITKSKKRQGSLVNYQSFAIPSTWRPELEFLKSLWGLGTEEEKGYHTGQPGYIGLRNSFLGINSGVPYMFKNTDSGVLLGQKE